ncbi:MAG: phosphopantetheine-binding protein [Pseudomonadota bacterium]|nr:acyl carrier protein [Gammaproteobacteria bacterium]MDQ3581343.1 phosphopantetheine-binding protein [Pseudomonadota bacterium]
MSSKEQVVQSILEVAREMNESLARRIEIERGEDAPLFGKEGVLDSLGLVSFIVAVEQTLDESLGVTVMLADVRAVSQRASPFRTVGALADYVVAQMTGQHE